MARLDPRPVANVAFVQFPHATARPVSTTDPARVQDRPAVCYTVASDDHTRGTVPSAYVALVEHVALTITFSRGDTRPSANSTLIEGVAFAVALSRGDVVISAFERRCRASLCKFPVTVVVFPQSRAPAANFVNLPAAFQLPVKDLPVLAIFAHVSTGDRPPDNVPTQVRPN